MYKFILKIHKRSNIFNYKMILKYYTLKMILSVSTINIWTKPLSGLFSKKRSKKGPKKLFCWILNYLSIAQILDN